MDRIYGNWKLMDDKGDARDTGVPALSFDLSRTRRP